MIVGLTGGMGSGKSTILKMFQDLGADVYIADVEAKKLMVQSKSIRESIINAFGEESYNENGLNRAYLSKIVFSDVEKLKLLNSFVHPAVHEHFKTFVVNSKARYVVYESAILFKSRIQDLCTYKIVVTAPLSVRIDRIMKRDGLSQHEISQRLTHQNLDDEMILKADFVIENSTLEVSRKKVLELHTLILGRI